jgi:hypothetical protein
VYLNVIRSDKYFKILEVSEVDFNYSGNAADVTTYGLVVIRESIECIQFVLT